jgi:hypothetical protein
LSLVVRPTFALKDIHVADVWVVRFLPALVGVLVVVFYVGARLLSDVVTRFGRRRALDEDLTNLLARGSRFSLLSFVVITAIGTTFPTIP